MHSTNELSVIMATQFVKWWKTKFHAGGCSYKSISVLGSNVCDGRPSDTEELVRDDASSSYNNGAHINPGLASSSISEASHPDYLHHHSNEVKFEDFECDVQVEGCVSGEERKEFSFTFYDFDGHGKITKDDIAGLVRSIYGAVNDSITVPQGGKKTIKVRLTVTPEKTQIPNSSETTSNNSPDTTADSSPANNNNNNNNTTTNNNNLSVVGMGNSNSSNLESRPKLRNNVNVTIKENLNRDRPGGGSGRKEKELRERLSHHLDKPMKFNSVRIPNSAHAACRGCRNLSPEVFRDCSASPLRNRKKWRERVCSLQRPEIFEILQANMEKNNVNPCCRRDHTQQQHQQHPHHLQHSMAPCTHSQLISDSTCPVLPLLNENLCKQKQPLLIENSCPTSAPQFRPHHHHLGGSKVYDSHIHRSSHHHTHQHQCRKYGHHRSRSHDLSQNIFRHHLFPSERDTLVPQGAPMTTSPTGANQTCCNLNSNNLYLDTQQQDPLEILESCFINQQHFSPRNKNTNLANAATTHHQLKHRNREQEHARAMAQVISWLERENIGGCDKKFSSPNRKQPNPSPNSLMGSPPVVKKHEHHHVHEHIHHHYHHHFGKETPIIV